MFSFLQAVKIIINYPISLEFQQFLFQVGRSQPGLFRFVSPDLSVVFCPALCPQFSDVSKKKSHYSKFLHVVAVKAGVTTSKLIVITEGRNAMVSSF